MINGLTKLKEYNKAYEVLIKMETLDYELNEYTVSVII